MNSANEITITSQAADKLIAAHDADVALLYLFMRRSGTQNHEEIARALCWTMSQTDSAMEKLGRIFPNSVVKPTAPQPVKEIAAELLPSAEEISDNYTTEDIMKIAQRDSGFSSVMNTAEKALGRKLSSPELKKLFGIYHSTGLLPETLMLMLNYCADISQPEGRKLTIGYIEKVSLTWAKLEIFTLERAEDYIRNDRFRREEAGKIASIFDLHGRRLTSGERSYIDSWIDMGFGYEAVEEAYNRTVMNIGSMKWPYMNSILKNWHKNNIHSKQEIDQKDSRKPRPANAAQPGDRRADTGDLDRLVAAIGGAKS